MKGQHPGCNYLATYYCSKCGWFADERSSLAKSMDSDMAERYENEPSVPKIPFIIPKGLAAVVEAGLNVPNPGLRDVMFPPIGKADHVAHCYDGPFSQPNYGGADVISSDFDEPLLWDNATSTPLEDFRKAVRAMPPRPDPKMLFTRDANLIRTWEQVRFPRSKRVRIRKKWRKDIRNWASVPTCYQLADGTTMLDAETFDRLSAHVT